MFHYSEEQKEHNHSPCIPAGIIKLSEVVKPMGESCNYFDYA